MPARIEQSLHNREKSQEALTIVREHRSFVHDHFRLEALSREFPRLSYQLGKQGIYLTVASDNDAGTFKERGAIVKATRLKAEGVTSLIAPSAGNHARGSILAAKALGLDIHAVVPTTAPPAKKEGLRNLWDSPKLTIHTVGGSFDESLAWALTNPQYGALLHPYDDPWIVRGQGTLANDILEANGGIDHIVVPVGGGGLAAGIMQELNEMGRSDVIVHAVQAHGSDSLARSIEHGSSTHATKPNQRYGGSAVRTIGREGLAIFQRYSNFRITNVSDQAVEGVTMDYTQDRSDNDRQRTPNFEPTTLVALAGLYSISAAYPGENIAVVGTGYNAPLWPERAKKQTLVF